MTRARPVLLHAHLFKNAGTTLDWSLQRSFGDAFCDHRDDAPMRADSTYLVRYLQQRPTLCALSSHWLPLPPPRCDGLTFYPVLLLRDPVERVYSVYRFERQQAVDHPGTRRARSLPFQDYVRWRLEPGTGPVIRNYQLRRCAGEGGEGDTAAARLERARALLSALPAFGLVERYAEAMVLFEARLGEVFPGLDLAYRAQNVHDPADRREPGERRRAVEAALGPVYEEVLAANAGDLALYRWAQEEFAAQLATLGDSAERVLALGRRCARLSAG